MPKRNSITATAAKSRPAASKSTARKPLRDVSNTRKPLPKSAAKKIPVNIDEEEEDVERKHPHSGDHDGAADLDRLLLIHSELSSLTRQIDELVVGALRCTSKNGMKEVESFANLLSRMQTSLKPWLPRLQQVLSAEPVPEITKQAVAGKDDENESKRNDTSRAVKSPELSKWDEADELVSSSPLVSWRAGSSDECGRQLFLLTPLPRQKGLVVKCPEPSKSASAILGAVDENISDDLLEGVMVEETPMRVSGRPLESKCVSPATLSRKEVLMTPCLKFSPPRSCTLLQPLAELPQKNSLSVRQSTPFIKGVPYSDDSEDSEGSTFQYPQFLGIKLGNNRWKTVLESPICMISPPKTCVLMEPPDELSDTTSSPLKNTTNHRGLRSSLKMVESTPMVRQAESTVRAGKRPGENTLKKELWTRFEAASLGEFHFHKSELEDISPNGFLDRLDEVS